MEPRLREPFSGRILHGELHRSTQYIKVRYWETVLGTLPMTSLSDSLSSEFSGSSQRIESTKTLISTSPEPTLLVPLRAQSDSIRKARVNRRQFGCTRCNARFERRGHLRSHVDTVHDRKRPFSCPLVCGKVFGHRSSLNRHIRAAHGNDQNPDTYPENFISLRSQSYMS